MNQQPQQPPGPSGPNHGQQPPQPNTPQALSSLESTLIKLIDICHTNTTMLENWKTTDQAQLWSNIDQYIATLGQLYDNADQLPLQYTTTRKTLLYVSRFHPLLLIFRATRSNQSCTSSLSISIYPHQYLDVLLSSLYWVLMYWFDHFVDPSQFPSLQPEYCKKSHVYCYN